MLQGGRLRATVYATLALQLPALSFLDIPRPTDIPAVCVQHETACQHDLGPAAM